MGEDAISSGVIVLRGMLMKIKDGEDWVFKQRLEVVQIMSRGQGSN